MNYLNNFDWHLADTKIENGHVYMYAPEHPLAEKNPQSKLSGWVLLATHIASVALGEWLTKHESIFYKDGNPLNVAVENICIDTHDKKVIRICPVCQQTFIILAMINKIRTTDSPSCAAKWRRKFAPSETELLHLMWNNPQKDVAKIFGIRTTSIQARCDKLGILRPPLGYWRLMKLGWSRNSALRHLGWQDEILAILDEKLGISSKTVEDSSPALRPILNYLNDFDWQSVPIKTLKNGLFFYAPSHPLAYKSGGLRGLVNLVRHIASINEGRWLTKSEKVIYRDGNEKNINPSNLIVTKRGSRTTEKIELVCPICNKVFLVPPGQAKLRVTDTKKCALVLRKKFNPTADELWSLIWKYTQKEIARIYNTSPSIVRERCRELNVPTPPMGYWNLIQAGQSHEEALNHLG